jgi:hypothetical protein
LSWDDAEEADLDDYIGRQCQIIVGETDSGATRVESFVRLEPGEEVEIFNQD